jgi:hypothetical protein
METIETRAKPMYKGMDGESYPSLEALRQADEAWKREHLQYMGRDGRHYPTTEALARADEAWKKQNLFFIVHDAEQGRREIAPGTGKIRVCIGHFIETDPTSGKKKYVPAYREQTF